MAEGQSGAAQVFTVSPASGVAEAERCQANHVLPAFLIAQLATRSGY